MGETTPTWIIIPVNGKPTNLMAKVRLFIDTMPRPRASSKTAKWMARVERRGRITPSTKGLGNKTSVTVMESKRGETATRMRVAGLTINDRDTGHFVGRVTGCTREVGRTESKTALAPEFGRTERSTKVVGRMAFSTG